VATRPRTRRDWRPPLARGQTFGFSAEECSLLFHIDVSGALVDEGSIADWRVDDLPLTVGDFELLMVSCMTDPITTVALLSFDPQLWAMANPVVPTFTQESLAEKAVSDPHIWGLRNAVVRLGAAMQGIWRQAASLPDVAREYHDLQRRRYDKDVPLRIALSEIPDGARVLDRYIARMIASGWVDENL
jgi:hypothetical protein